MNVLILFFKTIHNSVNYKTHILIFSIQLIFFYINMFVWKKKKNNIHLIVSILNNIIIGLVNYYHNKFTETQYISITTTFLFISIINLSIGFYKNFIKNI
jgi:hypothetical protein